MLKLSLKEVTMLSENYLIKEFNNQPIISRELPVIRAMDSYAGSRIVLIKTLLSSPKFKKSLPNYRKEGLKTELDMLTRLKRHCLKELISRPEPCTKDMTVVGLKLGSAK